MKPLVGQMTGNICLAPRVIELQFVMKPEAKGAEEQS